MRVVLRLILTWILVCHTITAKQCEILLLSECEEAVFEVGITPGVPQMAALLWPH